MYEFYPDYVDYCHPNHPDCVTGVTCSNCYSTWNPEIHVAGALVTFSNDLIITSINEEALFHDFLIVIAPNPSNGRFSLSTSREKAFDIANVYIYNTTATLIDSFQWDGTQVNLDLSGYPKGIYVLTVQSQDGIRTEKFIIL